MCRRGVLLSGAEDDEPREAKTHLDKGERTNVASGDGGERSPGFDPTYLLFSWRYGVGNSCSTPKAKLQMRDRMGI